MVADAFLEMRRDVLGFETELTEQLARNEKVRAELEQRERFQRSLLDAAQVAIIAMAPPGLGFIFQDRGEQFVLKEGHPNSFAPGKRPFHTIIPAFVTHDGKPWLSFGVMGGAMQPQGHAQILMNLIDFGMNLQEAGDAPRIQHDGSTEPTGQATAMSDGGEVDLESGFSYETVRALMRKGHSVRFADGPYGGYQAIARDPVTGVYTGASESRKDGQAAGY